MGRTARPKVVSALGECEEHDPVEGTGKWYILCSKSLHTTSLVESW